MRPETQTLSTLELESNITTLSAELSAATYLQLELIGEYDSREGYLDYGLRSTAHWRNPHHSPDR